MIREIEKQALAAYKAEDRDIPDSDLDDEQPLTLSVRTTLGEVRRIRRTMEIAMHQNIYAYTPNTHPYPAFVSLNRKPDGTITLTVREPAKPGQFSDKDCGATVEVAMPRSELLRLFEALRDELTPPMMKAIGATGYITLSPT